jgi:membrane protein YdbS with pleckstrin-like domain
MPLPQAPTQQPSTKVNAKANNELAIKGILCILIGLAVVVSPYFITSPGMQGIVAKSAAVGWFALVLGLAFVGLYARRRWSAQRGHLI